MKIISKSYDTMHCLWAIYDNTRSHTFMDTTMLPIFVPIIMVIRPNSEHSILCCCF